MPSKLINVRLEAQDAAKANALKAEGVKLSAIVRDAIRAEYDRRLARPRSGVELAKALKQMHEDYPIPDSEPPIPVDVSNRNAASAYIRGKLQREMIQIHRESKRRRSA
jgi:hypothetical protein